ncbi:hypothetical protein [Nocardioides acrostichi]|uniref:Uncharacterized protein n=1 Tax=Nocardioides acrostichi TaxID=2784339 RepID=A0A930UXF7_9ACTN|nr:hypothetical protein [Nocardioides acrostichi]MBF4161906.1 hypothetical protein [Nocardioides acrostichi]
MRVAGETRGLTAVLAAHAPWLLAIAWSVLLLGPALAPGFVLSYDMVWVPDLAVRPDVWGLGTSLPRAVPSDAVVALLDDVVPGMWLQKLVLLGSLAAGGIGAAGLVGDRALVARLAAVTLWIWNPLVVERLVLGQWPVLVGYGVLPWVLLAGRRWRASGRLPVRLGWLVPLGSLSVSTGLVTCLALLAVTGRRRALPAAGLLLAGQAPWLVAGLLHAGDATSAASGAQVFALRGEGLLPAPLAALGLGGVWNAEVVPASREGLVAAVSLCVLAGLCAVGVRSALARVPRHDHWALFACWAVGFGLAVAGWALPGAVGWLAAHVPGGGTLRDGSRLLVLCAPLLVVLVAHGTDVAVTRLRATAAGAAVVSLGVAAVLWPVAVMPDAALGASGRLTAVEYPSAYADLRRVVRDDAPPGDVLVLPLTSYRQPEWNDDHKVLDPTPRVVTRDAVGSDALVVSGVRLPGEDPRVLDAAAALTLSTPGERSAALVRLGFGVVVVDDDRPAAPSVAGTPLLDADGLRAVALDGAEPASAPWWWTALLAVAWAAYAALPSGAIVLGVLRSRRSEADTGS